MTAVLIVAALVLVRPILDHLGAYLTARFLHWRHR